MDSLKYIQYNGNNFNEVKNFLKHNLKSNVNVFNLKNEEEEGSYGLVIDVDTTNALPNKELKTVTLNDYIVINNSVSGFSIMNKNKFSKFFNKLAIRKSFKRNEREDTYYYVNSRFEVVKDIDTQNELNNNNYLSGNYFTNEKIARNIAELEHLFYLLLKFSLENGYSEINWQDKNQAKYLILLVDGELQIFKVYSNPTPTNVYFLTRNIAEQAIEQFGEELTRLNDLDWQIL